MRSRPSHRRYATHGDRVLSVDFLEHQNANLLLLGWAPGLRLRVVLAFKEEWASPAGDPEAGSFEKEARGSERRVEQKGAAS